MLEEVFPSPTEAISPSAAVTPILGVSPLLLRPGVSPALLLLDESGSLSARSGWAKTDAPCCSVSSHSRIRSENLSQRSSNFPLQPLDLKSLQKIGRNASSMSEANSTATEVIR